MAKDWMMVIQYLISGEDSRMGIQDYWNGVFLAGMNPLNRACLGFLKVLFLLTLSTGIMMLVSRL